MQTQHWPDGYEISTDPKRLDVAVIHGFLARESYRAPGIPRAVVERSILNSLCFGVYRHDAQVGLARVVTDQATFALLADVFIVSEHRGKGLSKRLLRCVAEHEDLQGLRRLLLLTSDAHELYPGDPAGGGRGCRASPIGLPIQSIGAQSCRRGS